jgi:RNA polymerase sigma factor (sigma-70 family)
LSDRTDEELLVRLRLDQTAFVEFYDRHVDKVIRFAARRLRDPEAVADAVGAVFVELFETVGRYRPNRGTAIGWLYGVARNVVAEHRREASLQARVVAKLSGQALVDAVARRRPLRQAGRCWCGPSRAGSPSSLTPGASAALECTARTAGCTSTSTRRPERGRACSR